MHSLPPIESLRCFVVACGAPSFRKAARTANLSAAAFGQRIQQFEDYIGQQLFVRSPRCVELTDVGRRLLPKVEGLLNEVSSWPSVAQSSDAPIPRRLILGTRHELGLSWLNPMVLHLEKAIPGLRLDLHFGSGGELFRLIENEEIDAAVSSARLHSRRFGHERLHEERYCLVASPKKVDFGQLRNAGSVAQLALVDTTGDLPLTRYWLDAEPSRSHLQFSDIRCLGTIGAVRDFVVRQGGVAVLPEYFVQSELASGRLRKIFPRQKLLADCFRLVFLPKHRDAEVLRKIAQLMRDHPLK